MTTKFGAIKTNANQANTTMNDFFATGNAFTKQLNFFFKTNKKRSPYLPERGVEELRSNGSAKLFNHRVTSLEELWALF